MKKIILLAAFLFMACGCSAEEPPVVVKLEYRTGTLNPVRYPNLHTIAMTDKVTIKKISANKGRCKGFLNPALPDTLSYGDVLQYSFTASSCQQVLEVEIVTDNNTWTFTFDQ